MSANPAIQGFCDDDIFCLGLLSETGRVENEEYSLPE